MSFFVEMGVSQELQTTLGALLSMTSGFIVQVGESISLNPIKPAPELGSLTGDPIRCRQEPMLRSESLGHASWSVLQTTVQSRDTSRDGALEV